MGAEAIWLLLLLAATFAFFVFEVLPVEVTALCMLSLLTLSGLVSLDQAVAGFSNPGVLTIGGLFVLSHALVRTGFLEVAAERLSRRFGKRPWLGIAVLLLAVALMSGFLNNTAVVVITIPLAVDLCRRFQLSPSRVLIPLSYAAIIGGTLTLIGTSTNLLVSSIAEDSEVGALSMFDFLPLGSLFLVVGLIYILVVAPRFLPARITTRSLTVSYKMDEFLTELRVDEGSKLVGRTVLDSDLSRKYDVTVLTVIRGSQRFEDRLHRLPLEVGDLLIVRCPVESLPRLREDLGVALLTDVKLTEEELLGSDRVVLEALIPPRSRLIGRTLQEADFRRHFGGFVLAIRHLDSTRRTRIARARLRLSDTLLLITSRDRLEDLRSHGDLIITSELDLQLRRQRYWWLPLVLIPAIVGLAAAGVVDILLGVLLAVAVLFALKVINPADGYRAIDWSVVVFIAAFIPVGAAMTHTGLAEKIASIVLAPSSWMPEAWAPWVAVSVLYLATSIITELVTNNAAAIVLTPVAISMAASLGVDPKPLILAVCFAASASFLTPTGYQTNLMVYGPGGYRFTDFLRFGAPLNLLFWILATVCIPVFWSF
ncbi:MAG: SLC13 family permease [Acidobacteriota bacterium]|nr:SLC13 family permease [Acidobacteriota bacterium]